MFKFRALVIGIITETVIFIGLMCLLATMAQSLGNVTGNSYRLIIEFISILAVFIGAFISARIAWERGAIYGGIVAVVWIILRILFTVISFGKIDFTNIIVKTFIIIGVGIVGGAMGIARRKHKIV